MIRSLRAKLALSHVIPTILLLPLLSLYLLFALEDNYLHGLLRQLEYQADLVREDLEHESAPIVGSKSAQAFLDSIAPSTDSHVMLLDSSATILGSTRLEDKIRIGEHYGDPSIAQALGGQVVRGLGPGLSSEVAYVVLPWRQSESTAGVLRLSYEVSDVRAQFDQMQWLVVSGSLLAVAVALGLALGLATTITRPLRQLSENAKRIAAGNYASRVTTSSLDEIGALAASFNQMAEHLEEAQQARERQLAAIAHELARPLTGMRATIEALQDGADQDLEARGILLAGTEEELTRLERLVGTLQGLQKRSVQPLQLNRTETAVDRLVHASLANFEPVAARSGVSLYSQVPVALPKIYADEDRIIQVLTNLLDNACKFTPRGGRIVVRVSDEPDGIQISVTDTGVGISPEEMPNIFQQFYRGDESRPPEKRGMGLGLAICREIITAHQGRIWVESQAGKETTFTLQLPKGLPAA